MEWPQINAILNAVGAILLAIMLWGGKELMDLIKVGIAEVRKINGRLTTLEQWKTENVKLQDERHQHFKDYINKK